MALGPNIKSTTMRLPRDLMKLLDRRAKKHAVSRTRLVEWILRDYTAKPDDELRAIVTCPPKEIADENQVDLFA